MTAAGAKYDTDDLYPMLPLKDSVCAFCYQPADSAWGDSGRFCTSCVRTRRQLPVSKSFTLFKVPLMPISLAPRGEALANDLRAYKDGHTDALRGAARERLTALVEHFVARHGRCLAERTRQNKFDLVTWVPSAHSNRLRAHHPLVQVLQPCWWLSGRLMGLLERTSQEVPPRTAHPQQFRVTRDLGGRRVLLFDDTMTTGATLQSAAYVLHRAGARVSVVVIGRWFDNDFRNSRDYSKRSLDLGFDYDACVFCDTREPVEARPRPT